MAEYVICEEDQRVRKRWLWLTMGMNFLGPVIFVLCLVLYKGIEAIEWMKHLQSFAIGLLSFGLYYYCAYKKMGTKLLFFSIMVGILWPFLLFSVPFESEEILYHTFYLPVSLLDTYYCYALRRVNKKIKRERLEADPKYIQGMQFLRESTSMEELKLRFGQLIKETPSMHAIMKKDYKKLMRSFS